MRRRLRRRHRRVSAALIVPSPSHPGGQPLRCQPFRSYRSSTPRSPPTSSDLPFLPLRRTEKRTAAFLAGIDALPAGPVHFSRLPRVATFPHALVSRYIAPAFPSNPPPFRHCHCAIFPASLLAIGEARESEVDSPATLERFPPSRRLFHSFYTARGVCVSGTWCASVKNCLCERFTPHSTALSFSIFVVVVVVSSRSSQKFSFRPSPSSSHFARRISLCLSFSSPKIFARVAEQAFCDSRLFSPPPPPQTAHFEPYFFASLFLLLGSTLAFLAIYSFSLNRILTYWDMPHVYL